MKARRFWIMAVSSCALAAATPAAAGGGRPGGRIGVQGIVVEGGPNSFVLLSGDTRISVQMQDWNWYRDYSVLDEDRVVVFAPIDRALFQAHIVRPNAVYVAKLNTYFQKSSPTTPAAKSAPTRAVFLPSEPVGDYITISGRVAAVGDGRFELAAGGAELTIDTSALAASGQLAGSAAAALEVGDRVSIHGRVGEKFWTRLLVQADEVVKLKLTGTDHDSP